MTAALECPPRFATPRTDRRTLGGEVARLARVLGVEAMPWQELFWDTALEVEDDGRLAYREVVLTISGQCGKSTAALMLLLHRCLRWPGSVVAYGAQTGMDARSKLGDSWWPLLEHSPLAELIRFRRQAGHEALLFANGSRLGLVASTEKSGHGGTIDAAVLDESWAHADYRLEQSLRPSMVTVRNAQQIVMSTAGTEARSPFLWEKTRAGRQAAQAGLTSGLAYLEWSAPEDSDSSDPETWRRAIPAIGYTQSLDTIGADFAGMPRHEFERAYLNRWTTAMGDAVVSVELWESLAEPDSPRPAWSVLGVDVGPRGKSAAIVAVGEIDGCLHGAVLENGPGTDWLPEALRRVCVEFDEPHVLVDGKSVGHLLPELEQASGFRVVELGASDVVTACAFWLRLVMEGRLKHRGELELKTALDGAATRTLLDGWAWSRRTSGVDITSLVALTFATSFYLGSWGTR